MPSIKPQALLTGAGFSCNLGGLSGKEFLTRLSNDERIKANHRVASVLRQENADYESFYRSVIEGSDYDEDDRKTVIEAGTFVAEEQFPSVRSPQRLNSPVGRYLPLSTWLWKGLHIDFIAPRLI